MKSIIEREATFENNSDDMLNSQIHLISQAPRGSLPSK